MPQAKEATLQKLRNELKNANEKIVGLQEDLEAANNKARNHFQENNRVYAELSAVKKENSNLHNELNNAKQEKQNLEIEFQRLKENSLLKEELKTKFDDLYEKLTKALESEVNVIKRYELKIQLEIFIGIANQILG